MTPDEYHELLDNSIADANAYRDLFADLSPDEVRVITGLVRAMRESRVSVNPLPSNWHLANAMDAMHNGNEVEAAWHIAHAISQMGEP